MENFSNIQDNVSFSLKNNSEVGGLAYFLTHISEYLPYLIIVSFGSVFGVIGNLIVMLTIITNRELHSPTYILVFNLSIADIIVCGFVDSMGIFDMFMGESYFINRPVTCIIFGFISFFACVGSLLNLLFIAINRYINICHHNLYKKLFTNKLTLFYCVLIWILAALNNLPNLTGWNNFKYNKEVLMCMFNMKSNVVYNWYLIIINVVFPCMLILFCYSRIYVFTHKSKNRSNSTRLNISIHLAKTFFVSFMVYTICWMPFGLVLLINFDGKLPRSVVAYTVLLAILNSSLNPIIYAVFNSNFRNSVANLFKKICCCSAIFKLRNNKVSVSVNHLSIIANTANNLQIQSALYDTRAVKTSFSKKSERF